MLWFFAVWAAAQCHPHHMAVQRGPVSMGTPQGLAGMVAPHCPWSSDVARAFSAPADGVGRGLLCQGDSCVPRPGEEGPPPTGYVARLLL